MSKLQLQSFLVVALLASVLAVASPAAATSSDGPTSSGTPGLYAWPASSPSYTDIHYVNKVTLDPGPTANVFWANQFRDTVSGNGYIGIQTPTDAHGGRPVLFSVWKATGCKPSTAAGYGGYCVNNTDGSAGYGARIRYPWKAGVNYRLTVRKSVTAGWWVASLYDPSNHMTVAIGSLQFGGATGGAIHPEEGFVEYYNWSNPTATCGQQLNSDSIFGPITGDAGTVPYHSTSTSSTCTYADHGTILASGAAELGATPQAG